MSKYFTKAEYKKHSAYAIAADLMTEIKWQGGNYINRKIANVAAWAKVDVMTTRELYTFMKDNGYTWNQLGNRWQRREAATS